MFIPVKENWKKYTQRQYDHEKIAREIYQTVGHPSIKDYKNIIDMNAINNCLVTIEDIDIRENIFGPDI